MPSPPSRSSHKRDVDYSRDSSSGGSRSSQRPSSNNNSRSDYSINNSNSDRHRHSSSSSRDRDRDRDRDRYEDDRYNNNNRQYDGSSPSSSSGSRHRSNERDRNRDRDHRRDSNSSGDFSRQHSSSSSSASFSRERDKERGSRERPTSGGNRSNSSSSGSRGGSNNSNLKRESSSNSPSSSSRRKASSSSSSSSRNSSSQRSSLQRLDENLLLDDDNNNNNVMSTTSIPISTISSNTQNPSSYPKGMELSKNGGDDVFKADLPGGAILFTIVFAGGGCALICVGLAVSPIELVWCGLAMIGVWILLTTQLFVFKTITFHKDDQTVEFLDVTLPWSWCGGLWKKHYRVPFSHILGVRVEESYQYHHHSHSGSRSGLSSTAGSSRRMPTKFISVRLLFLPTTAEGVMPPLVSSSRVSSSHQVQQQQQQQQMMMPPPSLKLPPSHPFGGANQCVAVRYDTKGNMIPITAEYYKQYGLSEYYTKAGMNIAVNNNSNNNYDQQQFNSTTAASAVSAGSPAETNEPPAETLKFDAWKRQHTGVAQFLKCCSCMDEEEESEEFCKQWQSYLNSVVGESGNRYSSEKVDYSRRIFRMSAGSGIGVPYH